MFSNKNRIRALENQVEKLEISLKSHETLIGQLLCDHSSYSYNPDGLVSAFGGSLIGLSMAVCDDCSKRLTDDELKEAKAKKLANLKRQIAELEQ